MSVLLDVRGIGISFGGLRAVAGFSLALPARGLYGLIGPNGAGKTTAFNLLTGVYRPECGSIMLDGQFIHGLPTHRVARAGLSRTFQNVRLFGQMSVIENVMLACHGRGRHGLVGTLGRTPGFVAQERAITARALEMLEIFGLRARADDPAQDLPYGDQRRLEICRALASEPKVLLLDEPAAGLNPSEKTTLGEQVRFIRDRFGIGVLIIEHDMKLVMSVCEHITVLDHGVTIAAGTPERCRTDPKVIEAYLGEPGEEGKRDE